MFELFFIGGPAVLYHYKQKDFTTMEGTNIFVLTSIKFEKNQSLKLSTKYPRNKHKNILGGLTNV